MSCKQDKYGTTTVRISRRDVENWQGNWPCSSLAGPFWAQFDASGDLVDTNAKDADAHEFDAITSDALRDAFGPDHPAIRN